MVISHLAAALGGGWAKTLWDRRNTVVDRRTDRRVKVSDELLKDMPEVRKVHSEYRARRESGQAETADERTELDAARSKLQAAVARMPVEEHRAAVTRWLEATQLYAAKAPELPAWREEELWQAALAALREASQL